MGLIGLGMGIVACNDVKPAAPKEVSIMPSPKGSKGLNPESRQRMEELFKIYAPEETDRKLSREQIHNLLKRFSPSLADFATEALRAEAETFFTFNEFMAVLERRCVTLAWSRSGPISTRTELLETLKTVYPLAHKPLLDALVERMTRGWTEATTDDERTTDLIRRGIVATRASQRQNSQDAQTFVAKMARKTLWSLLGTLAPEEIHDSDREIARMLIGLSLESFTPDPKPSPRSPRAFHQRYFAILKNSMDEESRKTLPLAALEKLDWTLNETIIGNIGLGPDRAHFNSVFAKLAPLLNLETDGFNLADKNSLALDFVIVHATDDLMEKCELKPDRTLTKEFLQVFLFRISKAKNLDCVETSHAFKPNAVTYQTWRLRAAYEAQSGGS